LSCTPPASTSISTSVSIDEDETKPEKISDLEGSLEKTGTQEDLEELGLAAPSEPSVEAIINTGDDEEFNLNLGSIADPIVINKEFENSEDCIPGVIDPHLETEENVVDDDQESAENLLGIRPKALSSPDFMASYKPAHDPDRDWPEIEDNTDEIDGGSEVKSIEEQHADGAVYSCSEIEVAKAEIARKTGSGLRRGSSEERINIIRRRRFDTEPTIET